jgi:hypothetical protein
MEQIVREMSAEMTQRVASQRDWVKGHFTEDAVHKYETVDGKLYLLQTILDNQFYQKDQTMELQSLGITLGDALVETADLEWVEVEDEYGIDPALRYRGREILLFPLTLISKRIERDETVNIQELFEGLHNILNDVANDTTVV